MIRRTTRCEAKIASGTAARKDCSMESTPAWVLGVGGEAFIGGGGWGSAGRERRHEAGDDRVDRGGLLKRGHVAGSGNLDEL